MIIIIFAELLKKHERNLKHCLECNKVPQAATFSKPEARLSRILFEVSEAFSTGHDYEKAWPVDNLEGTL